MSSFMPWMLVHLLISKHLQGSEMAPGPMLRSKLTPGTLLRDYFKEPLVKLKSSHIICSYLYPVGYPCRTTLTSPIISTITRSWSLSMEPVIGPIKGYFPTPDIAYFLSLTSDIGVKNWSTSDIQIPTRHSKLSFQSRHWALPKVWSRHSTFRPPLWALVIIYIWINWIYISFNSFALDIDLNTSLGDITMTKRDCTPKDERCAGKWGSFPPVSLNARAFF